MGGGPCVPIRLIPLDETKLIKQSTLSADLANLGPLVGGGWSRASE